MITVVIYPTLRMEPTTDVISEPMPPHVDTEDLIDASGVAELLSVAHRNTVSVYQRRYPDMPRPVVDLAGGRTKLWLRTEIEAWRVLRRPEAS